VLGHLRERGEELRMDTVGFDGTYLKLCTCLLPMFWKEILYCLYKRKYPPYSEFQNPAMVSIERIPVSIALFPLRSVEATVTISI
jgi:hypothetical protein